MSSPYGPGAGNGGGAGGPGGPGGPGDMDRAVSGAHADYHREIQQHAEPDGLVDDVVTYRMLAPHLMRTLLFLVAPTVLLLLKFVIDYLASMSSSDDFTDIVSTLLGLVILVLYVAGIASFFAPAKEPIAEYARLLENRGDAATAAFEYVRAAAEARRSPAEVRPSTVAGVPVLLFHQYSERAMLLVQPYGRDLYVGWTMWRSRSTATLLMHFLRDTFGRFAPAPRFSAELRAAATRALRESVHSLAREGVAAATNLPAQAPPSTPFPAQAHPQAHAQAPYPAPDDTWRRDDHARDHQPAPDQHRPDDRPPGALPQPERPAQQAWTGGSTDTGGWTAPRGEDERVGVRRDTPRTTDRDDDPDDGWGPPPRDRW